jgi:ABC-type antimicrobial peptide transport system permease subunit
MTVRAYLLRSLGHYRFAYLGVFLGAVLGATVLLGALFAGDSVKASLRLIAENRIGRATHAVTSGDRFFRQALAADFARAAGIETAPVLLARGSATHGGTQSSASRVQLVGVTDAFWRLAPQPTSVPLDVTKSAVAINTALAARLQLKVGDTLILRLQRPGILSGSAPVAGAEPKLQTLRTTVAHIVDDAGYGRFSLETTQVAQPSVFVPIELLQDALNRDGRANLLLIAAREVTAETLSARLSSSLKLADYGLTFKWLEGAATHELTSDRVFLDPQMVDALTQAVPAAQPVLSYLVNDLRIQDRSTPYSIGTGTTAVAAPFLPRDLGAREVVLNSWLANDLQAKPGDELRLAYFQLGPGGALVERDATFRVRAITPLEALAADSAWMPEFPGITDTNNPRDWDPGLPLKLERIRDQDERYWDDHRGAPKVWLSLEGSRALWSTRWGNTTALRFAGPREAADQLATTLLAALSPGMNQLLVQDLRASALASAASPVDFAGLFIGMSFFLILAALGLVAMLFQFVLLQRNREDALLAAVGVMPRTVLRWRLVEGCVLLLLACPLAVLLAQLYTRGILRFLEGIWAAQAAGPTFVFHPTPASLAGGIVGFVLCSLFAIWLAIRKLARATLSIRLAAKAEDTTPLGRIRRTSLAIGLVAIAAAVLALGFANRGLPAQGAFYLAGFSLLAAGLAACRWWCALPLHHAQDGKPHASHLTPQSLGTLNLKARRSRSLTVVGLIATAVFMVLSFASFRKNVGDTWRDRASGTGGYAFWVETTAPQTLPRDGQTRSFDVFARHTDDLGEIAAFRAGAGDNANCFNLNTTAQPQLLATDTARLAARGAFRIKAEAASWSTLATRTPSGAIPAFVDENTLLWALKRKVGDTLAYLDEKGRSFEVQIVGTLPDSIFQGYLLVDEQLFLERFPSHAGYSIFLADARSQAGAANANESGGNKTAEAELLALRGRLESGARDAGGRVELTRDILASFHQIENTYIAIFNVLGSLGVVLGSLGLAIVIARNLRERRGEFAAMSAIGIPREVLAPMVFAEFGRMIIWGLAVGSVAALVSILPNLRSLPPAPTIGLVAVMLVGIVGLNLASGWLIFRRATRDLRAAEALS